MIWTFQENSSKEIEQKLLDAFKPTGDFYKDAKDCAKHLGIHLHPALREPTWEIYKPPKEDDVDEPVQEEAKKVLECISFNKNRIDKNTLRLLFHILPLSTVNTLKFTNNGFTISQFEQLCTFLQNDKSRVQTLYFDWNPFYKEDFRKLAVQDQLYVAGESEESIWPKLFKAGERLRAVFIRGNGVKDKDVTAICKQLETNVNLKVLDISNNNITSKSIESLAALLDKNKNIEFYGLAKNNLTFDSIKPLIDKLGKRDFPQEQVDAHLKKQKERDTIIEKNKKAKPGGAKDIIPPIDTIQQKENGSYQILSNWQFRHLNLCLNPIGEDKRESIMDLMK